MEARGQLTELDASAGEVVGLGIELEDPQARGRPD